MQLIWPLLPNNQGQRVGEGTWYSVQTVRQRGLQPKLCGLGESAHRAARRLISLSILTRTHAKNTQSDQTSTALWHTKSQSRLETCDATELFTVLILARGGRAWVSQRGATVIHLSEWIHHNRKNLIVQYNILQVAVQHSTCFSRMREISPRVLSKPDTLLLAHWPLSCPCSCFPKSFTSRCSLYARTHAHNEGHSLINPEWDNYKQKTLPGLPHSLSKFIQTLLTEASLW